MADLAQLVGELVAVERAPITFTVKGGEGTLRIEQIAEAQMAAFEGATGQTTKLIDTAFSTIPGSPAYASKASKYRRNGAPYGLMNIDLQDHTAIQGDFRFEA